MAYDDNGGAQNDYLNASDTASRPMALLSLIVVFLVITALALALFVGGRWAYDRFVNNNDSSQTVDQYITDSLVQDPPKDNNDTGNNGQGDGQQDQNSNQGSATDEAQNPTLPSDEVIVEDSQAQPSDESSNDQSGEVTTVTGPSAPEEVPNTGPGSVLAIFVIVSLLGAIAHRTFLVNKLK